MIITENLRIALAAIWANRMRSILTTLGIIIGVGAVIAVVSLVQGAQQVFNRSLESVGSNFVTIQPRSQPSQPGVVSRQVRLTWEDGLALAKRVPGIELISPQLIGNGAIRYREMQHNTLVVGTNADWGEVNNFSVDFGRFFTQVDLADRKKIVVLGQDVVSALEISGDPIGQEIYVGRLAATIVGVMEEKGRGLGVNYDDLVFVPFDTALSIFGRNAGDQVVLQLKVANDVDIERLKEDMKSVLRERHRLGEDDSDDFQIFTQDEILELTDSIFGTLTAIVAGVVSIALLVGGIGIMNIMLVSVTERTREIGVRKAMGARRQHILMQFLVEAITLCLVGGALGVAIGYGLGAFLAAVLPGEWPPAYVPLWAIALAFGFSAAVGVGFGIYPAARAAGQDPIESLRYE